MRRDEKMLRCIRRAVLWRRRVESLCVGVGQRYEGIHGGAEAFFPSSTNFWGGVIGAQVKKYLDVALFGCVCCWYLGTYPSLAPL